MTFLSCHQWLTGCLAGWMAKMQCRASLVAGDSDWANYLGRLTAFSTELRLGGILSCRRRRRDSIPFSAPVPFLPIVVAVVLVVGAAGMAGISN